MSTIFDEYLPSSKLDISENHLTEFFETMYQRQNIWYNRCFVVKQYPWSKNKILNENKFCNVYRELDKVSLWIIYNITTSKDIVLNKVWKICIARMFNSVDFLETVKIPNVDDYDVDEFIEFVALYEAHYKPSTNKKAFAINSWLAKGMSQGMAVAKFIMPSLKDKIGDILFHSFLGGMSKVNDLIKTMTDVEGIGKFVAHEWYLDLCYINKYSDEDFKFDENVWTNVGPGAQFGLRIVTPSKPKNISTIKWLRDISKDLLPDDFKYIKWNKSKQKYERCDWNITLNQIEFFLCEYAKYWKIKHKIGKQRDKYIPVKTS